MPDAATFMLWENASSCLNYCVSYMKALFCVDIGLGDDRV